MVENHNKGKNMNESINLSVDIGRLKLKNPVMTASGTFGYGLEYKDYVDLDRLGAIVVKGLSLEPKEGNKPPRIVETSAGMLNAIGLENIGIKAFVEKTLPLLRRYNVQYDTKIIVNIFGNSIEEYAETAKILNDAEGVSGLEINISCPNVKEGCMVFGTNPEMTFKVVSAVRKASSLPIITKLSPNVTDITVFAKIAEEAGTDAVSLINTLLGMAVNIELRKPVLANATGGLSGPAIKPVALRMVWEVCQAVNIPVIGIGGIMTAEDALEFIIAGAKAVQIGTANFVNPYATIEILEGIGNYLRVNGIGDINDLVGSLKFP